MDREYIETGEYIIQVNKYPKTELLDITDDLEKAFVKNHRGSQRSGEKELLNTLDGSILRPFGSNPYATWIRWDTYISPGGSFIALRTLVLGWLEIFNGVTGRKIKTFDNIKVKDLKFSPDESKMLILTRDNIMSMINLKDFNDIVSKKLDDNVFIESVLFSPDGLNLLIQIEKVTPGLTLIVGTTFQMWNSNNFNLKYKKDVSKIDEVERIFSSRRHRNHYLTCQTFSPDGTKIAFGTSLGIILLFHSTNGDFIHSFDDQYTGYLTDISISPDGKTVAGLSEEITAGVWNIDGRAKYSFFIGDKYILKMSCFDNCIALLELVDSDGGQESFNIHKYYRSDDQEDIFRFQATMNNHTKDPSETIFNPYLPIRNSFGSVVELVLKQEVDVAITLPDHKGYIIAKLNPAAAKQARKEMGLHKNYPLLFYKGKLVFKLEKNGYLVSASLREIIPSTTVQKLRDQIGLTPRTSSVSTQTMDSDDDDDDDVSGPQQKRQRTHELELLRLRF